MKQLLLLIFLFTSVTAFAKTSEQLDSTKQVDSLTFCWYKYKVPAGCAAQSEYQLKCDNYSIAWIYLNKEMLATAPEMFYNQLTGQFKSVTRDSIACYLRNVEAKCYKVSFRDDDGVTHYQLLGYGTVNNQPVLVQLGLNTEPKSNEDIPEFPRQIIRLTK
jgi:hypothetical protein